jgi:glycosyltransferase involved in cell wall biosynthesis
MINLSIILPTINESENLVDLIPEIIDELKITNILNYEILVIDDGSTDNTESVINKIRSYNDNVQLIKRKQQPSLPKSIYLGLELSKYEYTMWLDADGSMPAKDLGKLIVKQIEYPNSVIIGSRFVEGGGYKGSSLESDNNLFKSIYRIYNSEDSILATALSKLFNNLLSKLSSSKVIDMTSGFIIGKKQYFSKYCFEKAIYGEYFVKLIKDLQRKDIHCIEVGYICLTRKKGESKTSTNYFQLLKMGLPYIKEAYNLRNLDAKN